MSEIIAWRQRIRNNEEKRVGDIYLECTKRGCDVRFLEQFDTRIWLFPVEQTKSFLDVFKGGQCSDVAERYLKQWKIYLQVVLEKRPNHSKTADWEKSLTMIDSQKPN